MLSSTTLKCKKMMVLVFSRNKGRMRTVGGNGGGGRVEKT
jgi:hypothetical protein